MHSHPTDDQEEHNCTPLVNRNIKKLWSGINPFLFFTKYLDTAEDKCLSVLLFNSPVKYNRKQVNLGKFYSETQQAVIQLELFVISGLVCHQIW